MRAFLLDTNSASALFDYENVNHEKVKRFLEKEAGSLTYVSAITWGEIRYGYKVHKKVDHTRKEAIEKQMELYTVLDINKHTTEAYSEIRARLFNRYGCLGAKTGKIKEKRPESLTEKSNGSSLGIDENDLWIVAIAVEHNLEFITYDEMVRIAEIIRELNPNFIFINPS